MTALRSERIASAASVAAIAAVRAELVDTGRELDERSVREVVARTCPLLPSAGADAVVADVLATVRGLGPLEPLLADDDTTDVLVNGPGPVWVERNGRLEPTDVVIDSPEEISRLVERVVAPLGLRIDRSSPYVDARLPNGARLHASLPPIAVDGPYVAIRRFTTRAVPVESLATPNQSQLLRAAVARRCTIVISGATGAGKTTLLNALASEIDDGERIVTVEDTAELRLPKRHVVRLEARPANADGVGEVCVRDLVRNALRMRPDRLIVGECRGAEAFDMLQAINTGHRGSLTTCHANSAADAVVRLEAMALMAAVGLPVDAIRRQLGGAVDFIVHLARDDAGLRRVDHVATVDDEGRTARVA